VNGNTPDEEMTLADVARLAKLAKKQSCLSGSNSAAHATHAGSGDAIAGESTHAFAPPVDAAAMLPSYWRRDALACAIQLIYLASSAEEAVQALHLNPLTADELALQLLSRRSREFVSALADLRSKAIDRSLLRALGGEPENLSSEGESSDREFVLSGSDGEGTTRARRESDFILPPGWRTEKFRRKSLHVREFVDPQGIRYRTVADAQRAVDMFRVRETMSQRMRSKFSATLSRASQSTI